MEFESLEETSMLQRGTEETKKSVRFTVLKCWNRLLGEMVESPSLEVFK